MKNNTLFFVLLMLFNSPSFCQQTINASMKGALSLLAEHVAQIERSGYTIRGILLQPDWGSTKLRAYDLTSKKSDTIFVEAFAIVDKRDYTFNDKSLSVWEMAGAYRKNSKDSLVSDRSSTHSVINNGKIIDSWKLNFIPETMNRQYDLLTEYNFSIEALDDTKIGTIGNAKEQKNEREIILLIYSKS